MLPMKLTTCLTTRHGLPRLGEKGVRGDLMATLAVDLPRSLTDRQKELFEELRRTGT